MKTSNSRLLHRGVMLTVLAVAFTVSCGSKPEYNYTTPDVICDTEIAAEPLQSLLPPGDEFHAEARLTATESCQVAIDDVIQMIATVYAYDEYRSPSRYLVSNNIEGAEEADFIDGGEGALWEGGVISSWRCHDGSESESYKNVVTVVRLPSDRMGDEEGKGNAADFARSYFAGLYDKLQCNL